MLPAAGHRRDHQLRADRGHHPRQPGPLCAGPGPRDARASARTCWTRAPAGVVVAHRQRWRGDGQIQPDRPRITRCGRGDDGKAAVRIAGMAGNWPRTASVRSKGPAARCGPRSAAPPATALLRRPTRRPSTRPGHARRSAARRRMGSPAASGLTGRGSRTCTSDRGRRERPDARIRPWRQPGSRGPPVSGMNRSPACRASLCAHTTHSPSTVVVRCSSSSSGRPGWALGAGHEIRYQAISPAHGDPSLQ